MNGNSREPKRFKKDETSDPMHPNPSIVIHVRNLNPKATEADLMEALSHFGTISYATCVPARKMALVEFEDINAAKSCINYASTNSIYVAGMPALFNFSTSQKIQRLGLESDIPNHIVVLTIINPQYSINADTIYQICKPHGEVKKIAIIRKHGIQCLVEFDSIESARKAKASLNGADIYSGCCTVKIEYSGVDQVKVYRNDSDQFDYTSGGASFDDRRGGLLNPGSGQQMQPAPPTYNGPAYGAAPQQQDRGGRFGGAGGGGYNEGGPHQGYQGGGGRGGGCQGYPPNQNYGGGQQQYGSRGPTQNYNSYNDNSGYGGQGDYGNQFGAGGDNGYNQGGVGGSCVVMIYGVDQEKVNCDKLFNLFCLYGNIIRIKFMRSKPDTAMLEMGDHGQVRSVVENLQNLEFDGMKLTLKISNQPTLRDIPDPSPMPDNSPSFKNYARSLNNRYSNPDTAQRNRVFPPTVYLHWYNAPGNLTEDKMAELLSKNGCTPPKSVVIYNSTDRSSVGYAEFETVEQATMALVRNNHTSVDSPIGKRPYIVKLAYTQPKPQKRFQQQQQDDEQQ